MFDGAGMFVCAWRRRGGGVLRLNSWAVWKGSLSLGLNLMRWSMTLKIRIHNRERKKEWARWRLNRFTAFVCQLWSPFENVNCFWNMKSFFLIAEGWVFLWCCWGRQKQVWDSFSSYFQFWMRHWSTVSMRDWLKAVGFYACCRGVAVRVTGSSCEWQMDLDTLALYNPVRLFVLTDFS